MKSKSDPANDNPFVRAVRDGDGSNPAGSHQSLGNNGQVVAATVQAMGVGEHHDPKQASQLAAAMAPSRPIPANTQSDGGRMEAVVDLLFGNHLTEINARMRGLEKQVTDRINKAESEMRVRVESIDRHTKSEIDSLNRLFDKERATRGDAVGKLSDRLDTAIRQIETRIEKMEGEFTRTHEDAQKDIGERLAKATGATTQLREGMEQEIASMKASLSTRAELSGMFAELGKRLEANASGGGLD